MMQKITVKKRAYNDSIHWPETVHPLLQRIYSSRNICDSSDIDLALSNLLPPDDLRNIQDAAQLLSQGLEQNWNILIIGDFDADGATSTALAIRALKSMGARRVSYLVPNRFEYGYGLTKGIVQEAIKLRPDLIITVDNGISSLEGVAFARQNDIKVLVTDHHLQGERLPDADIIVNPNQQGDMFKSKALAGVGVIFYVLVVLRQQLRQLNWFENNAIKEPSLADYLDIVALGTVADVVPLDRNNRILVNEGLRRIRAGKSIKGITALLEAAGKNPASIVAADLGFAVGPRLNAAGRLDDMSIGIECLLADSDEAYQLAYQLDKLNRERRNIETGMQIEALQHLEKMDFASADIYGLALFDDSWHQGVIGILASRIKEKIHRPVIIFAPGDADEIKGSARSIKGIHIRDVLETISSANPGLIKKFGGHAMAAGLSLNGKDFELFQSLFNKQVRLIANDEILENVILSDGELGGDDFTLKTIELLNNGGPWGQDFPEPLFTGSFRVINQHILKDKHYKLVVTPEGSARLHLDAIAFNQLDGEENVNDRLLPDNIELVYKLAVNDFRGQKTLQLIIDKILA